MFGNSLSDAPPKGKFGPLFDRQAQDALTRVRSFLTVARNQALKELVSLYARFGPFLEGDCRWMSYLSCQTDSTIAKG